MHEKEWLGIFRFFNEKYISQIYLIKSMKGLGLQVPPAPFGMDELIKLMKGNEGVEEESEIWIKAS